MSEDDDVRNEVADAINADPLDFYESNPVQGRYYDAIADPPAGTITIVALLKGNGVGGSWALTSAWSAIMFGSLNPRFDKRSPYGDQWPYRIKSARLISTIEALKDKGPLQKAMGEIFPVNAWQQRRDSGKSYYSEGKTATGWEWDVMTYDQSPLQAASANKSLILFSEPPPQDLFTECVTRLRGNGLVLIEMTQLDMAEFFDEYVNAGAIVLDGKKVGEVRVVRGDIEENCRDHHPGGQRAHTSILADIAMWPAEEREARRTGRSMNRSGRIYPSWGDANELERLPEYHQDCWDKGRVLIDTCVDPHDRKPWAMAWFATFPNEDTIAFAEWPPFDFNAARSSPLNHVDDYRAMILETEAAIGYPIRSGGRIGDPRFLESPQAGTDESVRTMLSKPCGACNLEHGKTKAREKCTHRLHYKPAPDSARINHAVVRAAIGNAEQGVRPKLYALKGACPNVCFGARHYSYYEDKNKLNALSEKPAYKVKDFCDVVRYRYNARMHLWPEAVERVELWKPKVRGPGTTTA